MAFRERHYSLVPFDQIRFAVLTIAIETAEPTLALLSAPDTGTLGHLLPAVWANILVPEFKEIIPL